MLRHDKAVLDETTALQASGIEGTIPNELFGWWMLTFNLRLETSDAAIIRGKAPNYSLPRVQQAMREMWGAGTLAEQKPGASQTARGTRWWLRESRKRENLSG